LYSVLGANFNTGTDTPKGTFALIFVLLIHEVTEEAREVNEFKYDARHSDYQA
jgi:hypothetical protein